MSRDDPGMPPAPATPVPEGAGTHPPEGPASGWRLSLGRLGFTLLELLLVLVIIGVLSSMASPSLHRAMEKARVARAIGDIKTIEIELLTFEAGEGTFPLTLASIGRSLLLDPWGNPYRYLPIRGSDSKGKGAMRKDRFLVPINSDFDLYSTGPDGKTASPLTAQPSHDDIIRANDGGYIGEASGY